jgi:hypothetical protein
MPTLFFVPVPRLRINSAWMFPQLFLSLGLQRLARITNASGLAGSDATSLIPESIGARDYHHISS